MIKWILYYFFGFVILGITFLLLSGCSVPEPEKIITEKTTETVIKDGTTEFCNYEIVNLWCYDANDNEWIEKDINSYTQGQATVQLTIIHNGGETSENITVNARKNASIEIPVSASAKYNDYNGILELNTDENGKIQFKHLWGAEEARKINLVIKLTMIRK